MRRLMYDCYLEGRRHAQNGGGLSGCPYADLDGMAWKDGVRSWLDEHPDPEETDAPGCPTRRDLDSTHIKTRPETGSQ